MIQRCEETGLKLNPDKCKIKQEQIKFYGVICCAQGLKPDPEKAKSLQNMKAPENIKELHFSWPHDIHEPIHSKLNLTHSPSERTTSKTQ
ncbi:Pol polyprotein [Elysia marginata]|uniref:Pol polyprotein n=1 Tax=Elysia marginata TaxID=1093978 RepID=A0AAV4G0Y7_9GAST|nr:Pol polyprotein [Elysia marginata]